MAAIPISEAYKLDPRSTEVLLELFKWVSFEFWRPHDNFQFLFELFLKDHPK